MNVFEQIPVPNIKRNGFDLSHERKFTMEMGKLVPVLCQPVVPGDTFKCNTEVMIRFAPMIAPIMHRVECYVHYFFVPNRLVWDNFRTFITGGEDGTEEPALPHITTYAVSRNLAQNNTNADDNPYFGISSLWDYLGLPCGSELPTYDENPEDDNIKVSLLPFKAYQLIYNEYYRDQNLEEPVNILTEVDGGVPTTSYPDIFTLRKRAWKKDYFTGALPFPQRGEDVMLPLHGNAPLTGLSGSLYADYLEVTGTENTLRSGAPLQTGDTMYGAYRVVEVETQANTLENASLKSSYSRLDYPNAQADLTAVTAATVNELRRAVALQTFLERSARGGNRYIEYLLSHFGVKSSDARLQRPEYLGGGVMPVVISEVLQNSATSESSPQGTMSGHGIAVGKSHKFKAYFEEHGYVIGIMSVIPKATYQQGIPRDFLKMDRFDWYIPAFAHLGEQEIYNAELYAKSDNPHGLFGYTPRYSEYKYIPSSVHGDFRQNMNFWHLGRIFDDTPTLSKEFMQVDEASDGLSRIFAAEYDPTTGEERVYQHLWCYVYNNVKAIRPMPIFGVPKIQ